MSARIAEELSKQTRELVSRFEQRANGFRGRDDLSRLIVPVDVARAEESAKDIFGEGEHTATGIDGSMDFDERLQMMLFYSNATAYSCPFTVGRHLRFDLAAAHREEKLAASAAVPLWAEDVATVFSREPELDIELEHSMDRIPNSFMTLGELYLALKAVEKSEVVFLDRPLSGTFSTLSRDARNLLKRGESRLADWNGGRRVSMLDLELAVSIGSPATAVPTRRRFLPLAMIKLLTHGPMGPGELARSLGVGEADVRRSAKAIGRLDSRYGNALLADSSDSRLKLNEGVAGYWERVSALSLDYSKEVFEGEKHPLAVGGDQYLTILDVNTVALFLLWVLCEKAQKAGSLLIGIAKDTTATDITRAVLPFASSAGFVKLASPPPRLKNDKAFLAILSSENPSIRTPWRTVGYDSSYSTMVEIDGKLVGARKVVSRERLFARSFFQLRTLKSDPAVRSQVFLFDRMYDEAHDSKDVRRFEVLERVGETTIDAYFEGDGGSDLSNLVLHILSLNDNPEVFEAYGHNQLLYLADKAVKADVRMLRSSLRGVADLRVGGVSRRRKIFGLITTYRQQRAEAEHARMGR
ncbi:MAG TPA: hypothetical protein VKF15_05265 [Nitrososphaerales archaeon]|nr:hypothetical protein [Nitrososphaerales archaeon]